MAGKPRAKNSAFVDPKQVYEYLLSKGVSKNHALGMITNMHYESGFNATAIGDKGTSAGLFQHHASRKKALETYTNGDLTNWQKQIDFALTENITKKYLSSKFKSPEQASYWFTTNWERPSNKEVKAVQRQGWLQGFDGGKHATGVYNPSNIDVTVKPVRPSVANGNTSNLGNPQQNPNTPLPSTGSEPIPTPTSTPQFTLDMSLPNQDQSVALEFLADIEKETEKEKETEQKVDESEARKELEAKILQKKQQDFMEALQSMNEQSQEILKTQPSMSNEEAAARAEQVAQGYQFEEIEPQGGLQELPSIYTFQEGGEMEEFEEDNEEGEYDIEIMDLTEDQVRELIEMGFDVKIAEEGEEELEEEGMEEEEEPMLEENQEDIEDEEDMVEEEEEI
jgi:hypothetical protein